MINGEQKLSQIDINGKTLLVLVTKVDTLTTIVKEVREEIKSVRDSLNEDVEEIRKDLSQVREKQGIIDSQVGDLRGANRLWNGVNSLGIVVGSILSGWFGSQR